MAFTPLSAGHLPVADIFVVDSLGGHAVNLTHGVGESVHPAWSPDGSKIIFSSAPDSSWHLYVMNPDGSDLTQLTFGPDEEEPAWSPDGTKIAFVSVGHIFLMNANGSGITPLTNGAKPSWSPDRRIVFSSGCCQIFVINEDGSALTLLGDTTANEDTPSWSPDGRKIAFTSNRGTSGFEIWVMNADGTSPVRLTNSYNSFAPSWTPDGNKIVFVSGGDSSGIYMMNADGSGQTRLTRPPRYEYQNFPHWRR